MHNHNDKYPAKLGFELGTSRFQAPVDTSEPSGPTNMFAATCALSRRSVHMTLKCQQQLNPIHNKDRIPVIVPYRAAKGGTSRFKAPVVTNERSGRANMFAATRALLRRSVHMTLKCQQQSQILSTTKTGYLSSCFIELLKLVNFDALDYTVRN